MILAEAKFFAKHLQEATQVRFSEILSSIYKTNPQILRNLVLQMIPAKAKFFAKHLQNKPADIAKLSDTDDPRGGKVFAKLFTKSGEKG